MALTGRPFSIWLIAAAFVALVACSSGAGEEGVNGQQTAVPSQSGNAGLVYVSLGDSWPEGAHCDGCRTFPQFHAEALEQMLGRPITLKDLAGQAQPYFDTPGGGGAAGLLEALRTDEPFRDEVASGDIIVIATGPNDGGRSSKRSKMARAAARTTSPASPSSVARGSESSTPSSTRSRRSGTDGRQRSDS